MPTVLTLGLAAVSSVATVAVVGPSHNTPRSHEHEPIKKDNVAAAEKIATARYDICEVSEVQDLQTVAHPKAYEGFEAGPDTDKDPRGKVLIHINAVENSEVKKLREEHGTDGDPVRWSHPAVTTRAIVSDEAHPGKYRTAINPMKHTPTQLDQDMLPTDITLFPRVDDPVGTMTGIYVNMSSDTDTDEQKNPSNSDPASHAYTRHVENDRFCGVIRLDKVAGKKVWRKVEEPLDITQSEVATTYSKQQIFS